MNLFFVGSPLEYLNALEAKHHFEVPTEEAILLGLETYQLEYLGHDLQLLRVIDSSEWAKVMVLTRPYASPIEMLRVLRALNRETRRLGRLERLFMGGYLSTMRRHVANSVASDELVLLDEGSSTLYVHELRERRRGTGFTSAAERIQLPRLRDRILRGGGARSLLMRAVGVHDDHPEAVTYFTLYNLEPGGGDRVVRNDYAHLRSKLEQQPTREEVIFLGMPLLENRMVPSIEANLRLVAEAQKQLAPLRFVYKPHRHEQPDKVSQFARELGFEVHRSELPVELLLAQGAQRPRVLAGTYTSALVNCARIFGPSLTIKAFVLPPQRTTELFRAELVRIVQDYRDNWEDLIDVTQVEVYA